MSKYSKLWKNWENEAQLICRGKWNRFSGLFANSSYLANWSRVTKKQSWVTFPINVDETKQTSKISLQGMAGKSLF